MIVMTLGVVLIALSMMAVLLNQNHNTNHVEELRSRLDFLLDAENGPWVDVLRLGRENQELNRRCNELIEGCLARLDERPR